MAKIYFEVRPRYTAGSPGQVDESTARRVAHEEWASYQIALSGIYGRDKLDEAIQAGLLAQPVQGLYMPRGIVERVEEHNDHWLVTDLLMGRTYWRPFAAPGGRGPSQCTRCQCAIKKARRPVFVFGSNEGGHHGAGAAKHAMREWGAIWGTGIGHAGDSYAIPTKDRNIQTLPIAIVAQYVQEFLTYARASPDNLFLVTRVGCGLAGFTDSQIAPMFRGAPDNCLLPGGW